MAPRPPEQRAEAFRVWCAEGMQDDYKTAELTGIPRRTITDWRQVEGWQGKYLSAAGPEAEMAAAQGRMLMRSGVPILARRLLYIIGAQVPIRNLEGNIVRDDAGRPAMQWASDDRDAINAGKLLAQYGLGVEAIHDTGPIAFPAEFSVISELPQTDDAGEVDIQALRRQASAMIEATVQSVNTRTKTKGRRT